jgi:RNA polymerase sigma-70 factor (ECF subfamily)
MARANHLATRAAADVEGDERRWSMWMAQAQVGDEHAYVQLLTELARVIEAYLRSRFGALDMLDDCVQECLIAIHKARHTFDPQRRFRPWLFAIVRHRTIDMIRRQRRHRRLDDVLEVAALPAEAEPSRVDVGTLMDGLSANHRQAVLLTKFWGFSVRESADRLGVSENVVKVRVHRGLRELRALLESESA